MLYKRDVISVHNGNMKHARATEFDHTKLTCHVISKINTFKKKET